MNITEMSVKFTGYKEFFKNVNLRGVSIISVKFTEMNQSSSQIVLNNRIIYTK